MLDEARQTSTLPDLTVGTDSAWIEPQGEQPQGSGSVQTCQGWRTTTDAGTVLYKDGAYRWDGCQDFLSVACCAPVE